MNELRKEMQEIIAEHSAREPLDHILALELKLLALFKKWALEMVGESYLPEHDGVLGAMDNHKIQFRNEVLQEIRQRIEESTK